MSEKFSPVVGAPSYSAYLMVRVTPELTERLERAVDKAFGVAAKNRRRLSKAMLVNQMINHCLKDMGI